MNMMNVKLFGSRILQHNALYSCFVLTLFILIVFVYGIVRYDSASKVFFGTFGYDKTDSSSALEEELLCACKTKDVSKEYSHFGDLLLDDPQEEGTTLQALFRRHPNIGPALLSNETKCDLIPSIAGLDWDNVWQLLNQGKHSYHLYSVSCDRNGEGQCVAARIVALSTTDKPETPFCYLWSDVTSAPEVVMASTPAHIDYQSKHTRLVPFLITCRPQRPLQVVAVSLSSNSCAPVSNFLEINHSEQNVAEMLENLKDRNSVIRFAREPKITSKPLSNVLQTSSDIAICGPALFYYHEDISKQLIEWLEILKAMGVSQVYLYRTVVHPKVDKVLRYYEKEGFVQLTQFSYPSPYIDDPMLRRVWVGIQRPEMFALENTYFTDCILRNRHRHRYLMHLDPDELPILNTKLTLVQFIKNTLAKYKDQPVNVEFKWRTFHLNVPTGPSLSKAPADFFFFRHNMFEKKCTPSDCDNTKTVYDTRQTLAAYSHKAILCNTGSCRVHKLSTQNGFVGHYRRDCKGKCNKFLEVKFLSRFVERVVPEVNKVIKKLIAR